METVLVADRADAGAETASFLSERGYTVEVVSEGYRVAELAGRLRPTATVIRGGLAGPAVSKVVARIKAVSPGTRVAVLLESPDAEEASTLLRAGADALLADSGPEFLLWALMRVAEGGLVLSPDVAREVAGEYAESVLRGREWARELATRAREAEEMAKVKTDFLGNVSHELNTPLTIIKGLASIIRRYPSEQRDEILEQVEEAADKLTDIVGTLLTQAEIRRGEFSLVVHDCDLTPLIRDGAEAAASRYPRITLELLLPPNIPAVADARGIREVVRQLVDNACRYSQPGGTVTVKAGRAIEGINVHITDRGIGVARDQVAAAFGEPFAPGEEVMTKERSGLGLGLHLARNLVALHGGILWAEPLPAGGSRVSFTIPPAPPHDGAGEMEVHPEPAQTEPLAAAEPPEVPAEQETEPAPPDEAAPPEDSSSPIEGPTEGDFPPQPDVPLQPEEPAAPTSANSSS